MTKSALVKLLLLKSNDVMNRMTTEDVKKGFTAFLIKIKDNENYQFTLGNINWCATRNQSQLMREDKESLMARYKQVMDTLGQVHNYEYFIRNGKTYL